MKILPLNNGTNTAIETIVNNTSPNTENNASHDMVDDTFLKSRMSSLLSKAGMKSDFSYQRIIRGGNNQSFRIEDAEGVFFLKSYFQDPADSRNRLNAEFSFVKFCNERNIVCVPRALVCDKDKGLALYSWIEGAAFDSIPSQSDIIEASLFLKCLAHNSTPEMTNMPFAPLAADACLTLTDHINSIDQRLQNLCENIAEQNSVLSIKAKEIIHTQLVPLWENIEKKLRAFIDTRKPQFADSWIISPSDFGFHNALQTKEGLVFLDFEYAGRDGLVKTLCDFVCQPEFPVEESAMDILAAAIYENKKQREELLLCARAVLPACRLKWCCIMLNQFTKIGASRRAFATETNLGIQQEIQLQKVQNYINIHFLV